MVLRLRLDMERREFITLLGGAAAAWPLAARAQQSGKLPTIGFLGSDATAWSSYAGAFAERLRALGWIEGGTISIEYRWDEARRERDTEIAAEFVQQKVDVIVAFGAAVPALKQATSVIPIVFAVATDPIGGGLVTSLARPGGNVTGMSLQGADVAGKRVELLLEAVPRLHRLAIMGNVDNPQIVLEMGRAQDAARTLGLEGVPYEIRRVEDIAVVFEAIKSKSDALYVVEDSLVVANATHIIEFALGARLPTIFGSRDHAQAGGLMSYGPNFPDLFRHTADMVDKILRGVKPGDIPIEQPTKFEFVINLNTAKALGLTVPNTLLATADEVIE
jgi:putative ABC transport system substrate-binding protein